MPTVPSSRVRANVARYSDPQVDPARLPDGGLKVRADPGAFTAVAQGLGQVARVAQDWAEQEKQRADEMSMLEAERKLSDWDLANTEKALQTRGKDAMGLPDTYNPALERQIEEIAGGISDVRVRNAWMARAQGRRHNMLLSVNRHVHREIDELDATETQALIANSQRSAANNYNDPERIAFEMDTQLDAIEARAARLGMERETIDLMREEAISATHVGVLDQMVAGQNYSMAREYFAANRDDFLPAARATAAETVREAGLRAESQANADRILRQHGDRGAALAAARGITDPDLRDATVARVNQRFNEAKVIEEEQSKARSDGAVRLLQDSGGSLDSIPPDVWNAFSPSEQGQFRDLAEYLVNGSPTQNWRRYYDLYNMATGTPDQQARFAQLDLMLEARARTDDQHFRSLMGMQGTIREALAGNKEAQLQVSSTVSFRQTFESLAREANIVPRDKPRTGWTADELRRYNAFEERAQLAIEAREVGQRKLTPAEQRSEIARVLSQRVEVPREKWWHITGRHTNVPVFELTPDQMERAIVPYTEVPSGWRQALTQTYLAEHYRGRPFNSLTNAEQNDVRQTVGRAWALNQMGVIELDPKAYGLPPDSFSWTGGEDD